VIILRYKKSSKAIKNKKVVTSKQFNQLMKKFALSTIDDVINENANIHTIRLYCHKAATILSKLYDSPQRMHNFFKDLGLPLKKDDSEELEIMQWLESCLKKISKGKDADRAFNLKADRKRKNDGGSDKRIALFTWRKIKDGFTVNDAISYTVENSIELIKKKISYDRVSKLYYRYKNGIEKEYQSLLTQ
jgi:hypothetical protein